MFPGSPSGLPTQGRVLQGLQGPRVDGAPVEDSSPSWGVWGEMIIPWHSGTLELNSLWILVTVQSVGLTLGQQERQLRRLPPPPPEVQQVVTSVLGTSCKKGNLGSGPQLQTAAWLPFVENPTANPGSAGLGCNQAAGHCTPLVFMNEN